MTPTELARRLPRFLYRHALYFEGAIEDAISNFAASLPVGTRLLDAGAGEGRYAAYFNRQRYCGVDLGIGDATWNYAGLDVVADLTALPFRQGSFHAAIHIVTLEHLREPVCALAEIGRALESGGSVLIVVPHEWEVHQAPHDFFRFTRHGLIYLVEKAGLVPVEVQAVGGYFRLLARRLLNGLQFFQGGLRWVWFLPAAVCLIPPALVLPFLDFLDRDRNFTLGYICTARKSC